MRESTATTVQTLASDSSSTSSRSSSPEVDRQIVELLAELNNEGASHLENGLWREAISTFASALVLAMNPSTEHSSPPPTTDAPTTTSSQQLQDQDSSSNSAGICQLQRAVAADIISAAGPNSQGSSSSPCSLSSSTPVVDTTCIAPASKPKKTRRRKHKRRNSIGSTGSKDSSVRAAAAVVVSSRRQRHQHRNGGESSRRRRARSAMGRLHYHRKAEDTVLVTQDIEQTPHKYVYVRPLRVADRYSLPTAEELTIYMVYNLALAYQLQARAQEDEHDVGLAENEMASTRTWTRVINLYKLATALLQREHQKCDEDEDNVVVDPNSPLWSPTYTIALPNNLACAHYALGNQVDANQSWQQALSHLWCILDIGCTEQVDCFSQVLENAAHLMDPDHQVTRTASAA